MLLKKRVWEKSFFCYDWHMKELNWKGKKITILGLGRYEHGSGLAAVKFFIRQGADLVISDLQTEEELSVQVKRVKDYIEEKKYQGTITWVMGEHREVDILDCDLLVPNQAIPVTSKWIQLALENNIPIEHEMTLFFDRCPAKIIGITGTRGKSTTTALIGHLLEGYKQKVWVGGNIAKGSPLEMLDKMKKDDFVVLELSNFMLEYLNLKKMSPHIAVLLNVLPDHLNRYDGDMQIYADVKAVITNHQKEDDILITNASNEYTKVIGEKTIAPVQWFSTEKQLEKGYYLQGRDIVKNGEKISSVDEAPLRGEHNYANILAAIATVDQLVDTLDPARQQMGSFASLDGRLKFIDEIKGVTFINDTTSTTPVAAEAALKSVDSRKVILIAGGYDKELPLEGFVSALGGVKSIIWLPGSGTDKIKTMMMDDIDYGDAESMEQAVKQAFVRADAGDVILLSPGFASFGLFNNEFDRGDQFDQAIIDLKKTLSHHA